MFKITHNGVIVKQEDLEKISFRKIYITLEKLDLIKDASIELIFEGKNIKGIIRTRIFILEFENEGFNSILYKDDIDPLGYLMSFYMNELNSVIAYPYYLGNNDKLKAKLQLIDRVIENNNEIIDYFLQLGNKTQV